MFQLTRRAFSILPFPFQRPSTSHIFQCLLRHFFFVFAQSAITALAEYKLTMNATCFWLFFTVVTVMQIRTKLRSPILAEQYRHIFSKSRDYNTYASSACICDHEYIYRFHLRQFNKDSIDQLFKEAATTPLTVRVLDSDSLAYV